MTIAEFDHLDTDKKRTLLMQCCSSSSWADKMIAEPAFEDLVDMEEVAEEKWYECNEQDWLEAFTAHPEIGNIDSLKEKYSETKETASKEQSGIEGASGNTLKELANYNKQYKEKFGFIFIAFATGRNADEILQLLKIRINNSRDKEIKLAADEQNKITKLRIQKLFS